MKEKVYLMYKESLLSSVLDDIFTFGCLVFCIWFSSGSKFWTFVCCAFLIMLMAIKMKFLNTTNFNSIEEVKKYVDAEVEK